MIKCVLGIILALLLLAVVCLSEGARMAMRGGCQPSEWANAGRNTVPPAQYKPDIIPNKQ